MAIASRGSFSVPISVQIAALVAERTGSEDGEVETGRSLLETLPVGRIENAEQITTMRTGPFQEREHEKPSSLSATAVEIMRMMIQ
jgi:hypothetical protein